MVMKKVFVTVISLFSILCFGQNPPETINISSEFRDLVAYNYNVDMANEKHRDAASANWKSVGYFMLGTGSVLGSAFGIYYYTEEEDGLSLGISGGLLALSVVFYAKAFNSGVDEIRASEEEYAKRAEEIRARIISR